MWMRIYKEKKSMVLQQVDAYEHTASTCCGDYIYINSV